MVSFAEMQCNCSLWKYNNLCEEKIVCDKLKCASLKYDIPCRRKVSLWCVFRSLHLLLLRQCCGNHQKCVLKFKSHEENFSMMPYLQQNYPFITTRAMGDVDQLTLHSWYPLILFKSLQLIWRSGTRRFHLRVPDLQRSCSYLHCNLLEDQAPVPLTVFRSNLKFVQNLECST